MHDSSGPLEEPIRSQRSYDLNSHDLNANDRCSFDLNPYDGLLKSGCKSWKVLAAIEWRAHRYTMCNTVANARLLLLVQIAVIEQGTQRVKSEDSLLETLY